MSEILEEVEVFAMTPGLLGGLQLERGDAAWTRATGPHSFRCLRSRNSKATPRKLVTGGLVATAVFGIVLLTPQTLRAQMGMSGTGRSLGGYGAGTIGSYYSGNGSGYLPYNGGGGYIPFNAGRIGGMGVQPIPRRLPQTAIGGTMMAETPIGGGSLLLDMGGSSSSRGMSRMSLPRSFMPFGYEGGIGMGAGMPGSRNMTKERDSRYLDGPGLGYPFRMPASLSGTSSMPMP